MADTVEITNNIKTKMESLLFHIGQGLDHQTLHMEALNVHTKIVSLKQELENTNQALKIKNPKNKTSNVSSAEEDEIEKVKRKLPKWAKSPEQINSKLLTIFLELKRSGEKNITEEKLKNHFGNDAVFYKNLPQMTSISPKNHAKIFDRSYGLITIWDPVTPFVEEFEKAVFGS